MYNINSRGLYFDLLFELFVKIVLQIVKVSENFERALARISEMAIDQTNPWIRTENCDVQIG